MDYVDLVLHTSMFCFFVIAFLAYPLQLLDIERVMVGYELSPSGVTPF